MTQSDLILTDAKERHKTPRAAKADGQTRKEAGQARVLANESGEWIKGAMFLFRSYVDGLGPGAEFAMEDVRAYLGQCRHPEPHDHHIWGALPRIAIARGMPIRRTDRTRPAHSPKTHAHPVALYVVTQS